jgi:hypothetical protein
VTLRANVSGPAPASTGSANCGRSLSFAIDRWRGVCRSKYMPVAGLIFEPVKNLNTLPCGTSLTARLMAYATYLQQAPMS